MKHIILVDDDLAIQDAVRIMLQRRHYTVTSMDDGGQLLDGTFRVPDLFILDRQLPGVDGLEICYYLKSGASTRHIPVIILSASPQTAEAAGCARADAFLEKPFRMQTLMETINRLIR